MLNIFNGTLNFSEVANLMLGAFALFQLWLGFQDRKRLRGGLTAIREMLVRREDAIDIISALDGQLVNLGGRSPFYKYGLILVESIKERFKKQEESPAGVATRSPREFLPESEKQLTDS